MRFSIGIRMCIILFSMLAGITIADTPTSPFDPRNHKGPKTGPANELLVLGTPHIAGFPKNFDRQTLVSLIDHLAKWQPKAIAVEALSGKQCAYLRQYPARFNDTYTRYCWKPDAAIKATGLSVLAANTEMDKELAHWPQVPTPAQRRHLASVMLAAGEYGSGLVQWLRLQEDERHAGDGLNKDIV